MEKPKNNQEDFREDLERRAQEAEEKAQRTGTGAYSPEAVRQRTIENAENAEGEAKPLRIELLRIRKEKFQKEFNGYMGMEVEIVNNSEVLANLAKDWLAEGFVRRGMAIPLGNGLDIKEKLADVLAEPSEFRIALFNEYAIVFEWNPKPGSEGEEAHQ